MNFPDEAILRIFHHLSVAEIAGVERVSKQWRCIAWTPYLWLDALHLCGEEGRSVRWIRTSLDAILKRSGGKLHSLELDFNSDLTDARRHLPFLCNALATSQVQHLLLDMAAIRGEDDPLMVRPESVVAFANTMLTGLLQCGNLQSLHLLVYPEMDSTPLPRIPYDYSLTPLGQCQLVNFSLTFHCMDWYARKFNVRDTFASMLARVKTAEFFATSKDEISIYSLLGYMKDTLQESRISFVYEGDDERTDAEQAVWKRRGRMQLVMPRLLRFHIDAVHRNRDPTGPYAVGSPYSLICPSLESLNSMSCTTLELVDQAVSGTLQELNVDDRDHEAATILLMSLRMLNGKGASLRVLSLSVGSPIGSHLLCDLVADGLPALEELRVIDDQSGDLHFTERLIGVIEERLKRTDSPAHTTVLIIKGTSMKPTGVSFVAPHVSGGAWFGTGDATRHGDVSEIHMIYRSKEEVEEEKEEEGEGNEGEEGMPFLEGKPLPRDLLSLLFVQGRSTVNPMDTWLRAFDARVCSDNLLRRRNHPL